MAISNHLKIEFGKYINNLPNTVTPEHIIPGKSGIIRRRVEAGEPNFPTAESFSFALANLDPLGNERYPLSYWEGQARTEGEGATMPLQIYFKIYVDDGEQFLGMLTSLTYSKDRAACNIQVGDILEIGRKTEEPALAAISFKADLIAEHEPGVGRNDLEVAQDLDGDNVQHSALSFLIENKYSTDEYADLTNPLAVHLGLETADFTNPYESTPRTAWVQIEEITLLTRVQFIKKKGIYSSPSVFNRFHRMEMVLWHNAEDPIIVEGTGSADDVAILPRGQFRDRDGNKLTHEPGDASVPVSVTFYEPDLGNGTEAVLEYSDLTEVLDADFIFGVPFTDQSTHIEITSATYAYFDVISKTEEILEKLINGRHSDSGSAFLDFVDDAKVTKYRHAFWSDIKMFGWADKSIAEITVGAARQTASYIYTDRFGKIVFHPREYHQTHLDAGAPETRVVQNRDWEELDGPSYEHGFSTYSTEVPFDIIEIDNVVSEDKVKLYSDQNGAVSAPALRNKPAQITNFRIYDLGVPDQQYTTVDQHSLRYSPSDPSFPNPEDLEDFIPTARTQLNAMAAAFPWPTALSRIKLGRDYINNEVDIMGTPTEKHLDYIVDENDQLWWVREETLDILSLTVEIEIQLIGTLYAET